MQGNCNNLPFPNDQHSPHRLRQKRMTPMAEKDPEPERSMGARTLEARRLSLCHFAVGDDEGIHAQAIRQLRAGVKFDQCL